MKDINLGSTESKTDKKGNLVITFEKGSFKDNAPEAIKESFDYMKKYSEEVQSSAVDLATKAFKGDKDLKEVVVTAPFGMTAHDKVQVMVTRSKEVRNLQTKEVSMQPAMRMKVSSALTGAPKHFRDQKARLKETMANV